MGSVFTAIPTRQPVFYHLGRCSVILPSSAARILLAAQRGYDKAGAIQIGEV